MREFLSFIAGVAITCVLGFIWYTSNQVQLSLLMANAQGKVEVMQQFCKPMLENTGIIKKGKQDVP